MNSFQGNVSIYTDKFCKLTSTWKIMSKSKCTTISKTISEMQSSQGGDPSPKPWLGDSRKIGPGMQEKALGFS